MNKKRCKDCEYFRPRLGKYGAGLCISDESKRGNKDFTLSNDTCKAFYERTED